MCHTPITTHIKDLILAEVESFWLLGRGEGCLEGLTCSWSRWRVRVTLRQNPMSHQALQKRGKAAAHLRNQLFKSLLGGLPDTPIVILVEQKKKNQEKDRAVAPHADIQTNPYLCVSQMWRRNSSPLIFYSKFWTSMAGPLWPLLNHAPGTWMQNPAQPNK